MHEVHQAAMRLVSMAIAMASVYMGIIYAVNPQNKFRHHWWMAAACLVVFWIAFPLYWVIVKRTIQDKISKG
jgi:diacylglycerol kinase